MAKKSNTKTIKEVCNMCSGTGLQSDYYKTYPCVHCGGKKEIMKAIVIKDEWRERTYVVQHNPNCAKPYLVRIVGYGVAVIDLLPDKQSKDAIGWGMTFEEAGQNALNHYKEQKIAKTKTKHCEVCSKKKLFSEFMDDTRFSDGKDYKCYDCRKEQIDKFLCQREQSSRCRLG